MIWRAFLLLLIAPPAFCQTIAVTSRGVLVARAGSLQLFDHGGSEVLWSSDGVSSPAQIVVSTDRAAVIDSLNNEVRIVDLRSGKGTVVRSGETPIDGIFFGQDLFLVDRDARALERIAIDGSRSSIELAADPAFLRRVNQRLYVYSRAEGLLQEINLSLFAVHTVRVAPFASDLEVDSKNAYLVYPRTAKVGTVSLSSMTSSGTMDVGAVPVDLTFASSSTALTARTLAIADPSAKRVWMIEGAQSLTQAIARGFLRGLLGLGLFGGRGSQFPTGVDRVIVRGSKWYAYDSSSGTLYRFTKSKSTVIAKDVAPNAFSVGTDALYVWNDAVRRLQRIDGNE
jgi:hypothetical protein